MSFPCRCVDCGTPIGPVLLCAACLTARQERDPDRWFVNLLSGAPSGESDRHEEERQPADSALDREVQAALFALQEVAR